MNRQAPHGQHNAQSRNNMQDADRTGDSRTVFECPPEGVCARERHNLLVIEAHGVEHISQVLCRTVSIWEGWITSRKPRGVSTLLLKQISPAIQHVNLGATSHLHIALQPLYPALATLRVAWCLEMMEAQGTDAYCHSTVKSTPAINKYIIIIIIIVNMT
jgi:hypothetical protein